MIAIPKLRWWAYLAAICLAPLSLLAASVPAGTQLRIRMIDSVDSRTGQAGDILRAVLDKPLVVRGQTLFPKGAKVTVQVIEARPSAGLSGPGVLRLRVAAIDIGDASYNVKARPFTTKGEPHARNNLVTGGGPAPGALMGVSLGLAGIAPAAAKDPRVESESVLTFVTAAEMDIPASAARGAGPPRN